MYVIKNKMICIFTILSHLIFDWLLFQCVITSMSCYLLSHYQNGHSDISMSYISQLCNMYVIKNQMMTHMYV